MTKRRPDELLESAYDGIQEYDNDLPRWWLALFALTAVLGIIYTVYVHALGTPTDEQKLAADMENLQKIRATSGPVQRNLEHLLALAGDKDGVEKGKVVFTTRCAPCHGARGEGVVGPNLTDEASIHGGTFPQIYSVILNGVPEKGMLAWKTLLPQADLDHVALFVWSIQHTNVPGKAPQGTPQ